MAKFKNVSPLGALDIPSLNRIVEAGEVFEVPKDLVAYFADQHHNFEPVVNRQPAAPRRGKGKADKDPDAGEHDASVEPSGDDDSTPAEGDEKEADR